VPKHARVIRPAPDPFIYACVSLDGTRAVGIEERADRYVIHGVESGAKGKPLCAVRFSDRKRVERLAAAIRWSCRWAGGVS
jgi:hypothetical protein